MNQEIIEVLLTSEDADTDALIFKIDGNQLVVNLNSPDCQSAFKNIFAELLAEAALRFASCSFATAAIHSGLFLHASDIPLALFSMEILIARGEMNSKEIKMPRTTFFPSSFLSITIYIL